MNIWCKPYRRRDGEIMIYVNNDRKVSIGISADRGWQSSKASAGQKKLWDAFCAATRDGEAIATGCDMAAHDEWKLGPMYNGISFAITDIATVGGKSVGADGLYVVRDGKAMKPRFEAAL